MSDQGLLEVGRITRSHGVRGEVVVELVTHRVERVAPGARLHTDRGTLEVATSRPFGDKFLVRFVGVEERNGADRLRATVLRAEPLDDPDELWVHQLVGSTVVDADGVDRGLVAAVQANPASDLLVLESGALVPVVFIVSIEARVIRVETPAGLFELYEPE